MDDFDKTMAKFIFILIFLLCSFFGCLIYSDAVKGPCEKETLGIVAEIKACTGKRYPHYRCSVVFKDGRGYVTNDMAFVGQEVKECISL